MPAPIATGTPEAVKARDTFVMQRLASSRATFGALLEELSDEGFTGEAKKEALSRSITRLRVRGLIESVDGAWRLR